MCTAAITRQADAAAPTHLEQILGFTSERRWIRHAQRPHRPARHTLADRL